MRKTLTIATSEVFREGVSNGKAWKLCNVTDTEGTKYSTFASLIAGQTYDCEVVEEKSTKLNPKTGKPYVNKKIAKVYGANFLEEPESPQEENKEDRILEGLIKIYKQNEKILEKLDGLNRVN